MQMFLPNIIQYSTKLNSFWYPNIAVVKMFCCLLEHDKETLNESRNLYVPKCKMSQTSTNKQLTHFAPSGYQCGTRVKIKTEKAEYQLQSVQLIARIPQ